MLINGYPLDEYQMEIVKSKSKNILVVAGAGSGKTITIVGKIKYLIETEKIYPEEILCISLTNDAVENLKQNFQKNNIPNIEVYTFHKLALEIIKENNNYSISDEELLYLSINKVLNNNNKYIKKAIKYLFKIYNKKQIINIIEVFINLYKSNDYELSYMLKILQKIKYTFNIKKYLKNKYLLLLIINSYLEYQNNLKEENLIDFNDMINICKKNIEEKGLHKKWKYIIVDEYQDTSLNKFKMIKTIQEKTNASFLGVGDDFQSIYRFTGCDLNIFINFNKLVKGSNIMKLVNTYRNPQELIDVAGSFIMKNKNQIKKKLISTKHINKPIKIINIKNNITTLKEVIKIIESKEIMIIGRNNKDIEKYIDNEYTLKDNYYYIYGKRIKYYTAHRSKGLECENIILINNENNIMGFPSKLKDEEILKYVKITKDYYPYEEERRLFYVALTRTKNNVYILVPKNESIFIKEIKKNIKKIEILNI